LLGLVFLAALEGLIVMLAMESCLGVVVVLFEWM